MPRPAFVPTPEMRRRVLIAAGAGLTHKQIALGLGIGRTTLQKHFFRELHLAVVTTRAELLEAMYKAALAGSATAARMYLRGRRRGL